MKKLTERIECVENGIALIMVISIFVIITGAVFHGSFYGDPELGRLSFMLFFEGLSMFCIGIGSTMGYLLEKKPRTALAVGILAFFGSLANMFGIYIIMAIFAENLVLEKKTMVTVFSIGSGLILFITQRYYLDFRMRIKE
jgi:hypothetical protein